MLLLCCFILSYSFSFADEESPNGATTSSEVSLSDDDSSSHDTYIDFDTSSLEDEVKVVSGALKDLSDYTKSTTTIEGDLIEVSENRLTVSASDTNGLKSILLQLLGDYETVVTDYTYSSGSGYTSHSIQIERDWAWICTAALFGAVIWCVFRGCVAILCRK